MYNTDKQQNECSDHGTYLFLHLFSFFCMLCACVHVFLVFLHSMLINPPFLGGGRGRGEEGFGVGWGVTG